MPSRLMARCAVHSIQGLALSYQRDSEDSPGLPFKTLAMDTRPKIALLKSVDTKGQVAEWEADKLPTTKVG